MRESKLQSRTHETNGSREEKLKYTRTSYLSLGDMSDL